METEPIDAELVDGGGTEPEPSTMVELMRGGAAITKVENDTLAQIALTRPRNIKLALKKALEELEVDPEFAEKQYYRIPFKDRAKNETSWVEGLSIKAAMALARCFTNITASARVVEENEHAVIVEGVCIDMESGFRVSKPAAVSKYFKAKKTGKMIKWADDRFPQVLAAGSSKAIRNAILNVIPESLQRRYWNRAKELAADQVSGRGKKFNVEATVTACLAGFAPFKVERAHLEDHLHHALDKSTRQEFADLKAILNALEAGETDVFQAFGIQGPDEPGSSDGPPATPSADVGNLFGGSAK